MFKPRESVEGADGTLNSHGIGVLLQREDDGQWRVLQEPAVAGGACARWPGATVDQLRRDIGNGLITPGDTTVTSGEAALKQGFSRGCSCKFY